jgi:hypothetical protein
MCAGGDWEYPVYFILYWDGTHLRAYMPTKGNRWNTDSKEAYGNDADADASNIRKLYFANTPAEGMPAYLEADDVPDANGDEMLADITARILPKPN